VAFRPRRFALHLFLSVSEVPVMPLTCRPCTSADEPAVRALVNADRLPGQAEVDAAAVARAVRGAWLVDLPGWSDAAPTRTDVLADDSAGTVVGAVSYAQRPGGGAGMLLWLHCQADDRTLADSLVAHVLGALGTRPVHAFTVPTPLSAGLPGLPGPPGLPAENRAGTRTALVAAGFTRHEIGRYFLADLSPELRSGEPRTYPLADLDDHSDPDRWELHLRDTDGTLLGQATLGRPVGGRGTLWQLGVDAPFRRKGLGHALLDQSLRVLAHHGAEEVYACLSLSGSRSGSGLSTPASDDGAAAERLLLDAGFKEFDRFLAFTRRQDPDSRDTL
jgi:GNAT superfamily N-acetyltransferase